MRNKRGSHVGMILSFSMFIVFLIFVYTIVGSHVNSKSINQGVAKKLEFNVMDEISDLVYISRIDSNVIGGCLKIQNPVNDFSSVSAIVFNDSGEIDSVLESSDFLLTTGRGFIKVYYSDGFFENSVASGLSDCTELEAESISSESRIFEAKIVSLINMMKNNYSGVKKDFGVPSGVDFHLEFDYENGTVLENSKFISLKREVFAKTVKINYLDKYAEQKMGEFIIRTW